MIKKLGLSAVCLAIIVFFGYSHFSNQEVDLQQSTPSTDAIEIVATTTIPETTVTVAEPTPVPVTPAPIEPSPIEPTPVEPASAANTFTSTTLSTYNGSNGNPAYIAVDGVVYDVSNVFINGQHYGYEAGKDLSSAFHGQHSSSFLQGLPVVGNYSG
ncbi:MAG: cytochrome b5 domain-containing protein [Candidatus Gracilibacteria bacterium]